MTADVPLEKLEVSPHKHRELSNTPNTPNTPNALSSKKTACAVMAGAPAARLRWKMGARQPRLSSPSVDGPATLRLIFGRWAARVLIPAGGAIGVFRAFWTTGGTREPGAAPSPWSTQAMTWVGSATKSWNGAWTSCANGPAVAK